MKIDHPLFLGYVSLTTESKAFIELVRNIANREGFSLWCRGGNPDRKGVAKATGLYHGPLRQSIPLKHSTYVRMYLRYSDGSMTAKRTDYDRLASIRNQVTDLRKTFTDAGLDLDINVPAKLR